MIFISQKKNKQIDNQGVVKFYSILKSFQVNLPLRCFLFFVLARLPSKRSPWS